VTTHRQVGRVGATPPPPSSDGSARPALLQARLTRASIRARPPSSSPCTLAAWPPFCFATLVGDCSYLICAPLQPEIVSRPILADASLVAYLSNSRAHPDCDATTHVRRFLYVSVSNVSRLLFLTLALMIQPFRAGIPSSARQRGRCLVCAFCFCLECTRRCFWFTAQDVRFFYFVQSSPGYRLLFFFQIMPLLKNIRSPSRKSVICRKSTPDAAARTRPAALPLRQY